MINRRTAAKLALLGPAALATGLHGTSVFGQTRQKVRIGLPTRVYWPSIPVHVAQELKFYEKAGLDAEITVFNAGTAGMEALAAGAVDFISYGPSSLGVARSKGVAAKVVAAGARTPNGCYVMVKANSPYKTMADLAGKKIGVTGFGSTTHQLAAWAIKRAKIDMTVLAVGGAGMTPYLMNGQVDAILAYSPLSYNLMNSGQARPLVDCGKEMEPCLPDSWVASEKLINERPQVVEATLNAIFSALRHVQQNKAYGTKFIQEYTQLDKAVCEMELERTIGPIATDGSFERSWFESARTLAELGGAKMDGLPPMDEWFTKRFVPVKPTITA